MDKKLFFFTASFPFGTGEQFIETEIRYLSHYFNKIQIIPYSYGHSTHRREIPKNVSCCPPIMELNKSVVLLKEIFNCSPLIPFLRELLKKKYFLSLTGFRNFVLFSLRTRKILSNVYVKSIFNVINKDSVIYFYWGTLSSSIIPFIKNSCIPKVVRFHGGDLYEYLPENYFKIFFRKELLQNISYAIFVSEYGKNYLVSKYSDVKFKHEICRLGVEDNGFTEMSNAGILRILSISNAVKIKRLHIIAEAIKLLKINVEWTHIGNGPLLNELKKTANYAANNINVRFLGSIPNNQVLKYYNSNKVDLFINVSESEGVPVTIMEAFSSGVPVFATNVGGVSELVDEKVGKLLPSDISSEFLCNVLEDYYRLNLDEKMKLKKQAKERWSALANAENTYKKLAEFLINIK
jgi:colanic acid/amylovoran biosynthesis glycosyltransferase